MTLASLEARIAAATGPDREIDALVAVLAGWEWHGDGTAETHGKWAGHWVIPGHLNNGTFTQDRLCACTDISDDQGNTQTPPRVTESIDAIVALIERTLPELSWTVAGRWGSSPPNACLSDYEQEFEADPPTPALALCLAFVQAMRAKEEAK